MPIMSVVRTTALTALLVPVVGVLTTAPAVACTPHVESKGPSVRIDSYPEPDVHLDAQGTYVRVVTCLG